MTNTLFLSLEILSDDHIRVDFGRGAHARPYDLAYDPIRPVLDFTNRRFADATADERLAMGRALYDWLNEHERFSDALEQFPDDNEPVALAVTAPDALGHLPWETLHDGTDFLVAREIRPVVPVRMTKLRDNATPPEPENRPLRVLFMATSPENVKPVLEFEKEEGDILAASKELGNPIELFVEESGSLDELGKTVKLAERGAFDIVHLTGHADLLDSGPVFLVEDDEGKRRDATPKDIAAALSKKPRLLFLSGCRTAESEKTGVVRSLSEQLIEKGAPAVLGWAMPVMDTIGIAAAQALYQSLGVGDGLFTALVETYRATMKCEEELTRRNGKPVLSNWHLLRLFARETVPGAFVTPPKTKGRALPAPTTFVGEFTDLVSREIRAIPRERFVGRRRLLQRALKTLKRADKAGVVLHGLGGNGKTCVAARLCDRLGADFTPVVVVGRLKESDLVRKLSDALLDERDLRDILAGTGGPKDDPFEIRLKRVLRQSTNPFLFVLDDFEQNYMDGPKSYDFRTDGTPKLADDTRRILSALTDAVTDAKNQVRQRVIVTSRFELDGEFATRFVQEPVNGFQGEDLRKLVAGLREELEDKVQKGRLNRNYSEAERKELTEKAQEISAGNARLLRWLYDLIAASWADLEKTIDSMKGKKTVFLEEILADAILNSQPEKLRKFLGTAVIYNVFALRRAFEKLSLELGGVDAVFNGPVAVGLLEATPDPLSQKGELIYRIPEVVRDLLTPFHPFDKRQWHSRAAELLFDLWWRNGARQNYALAEELVRLAREGNVPTIAARAESYIQNILLYQNKFMKAEERLKALPKDSLWEFDIEVVQGRIALHFGDGIKAKEHFTKALDKCPPDDRQRAAILFFLHNLLFVQGNHKEALYFFRNESLPFFDKVGDLHSRAVTLGKIADILITLNKLDEAFQALEESIGIREKLGDGRGKTAMLCKMADIQYRLGKLDQAMQILKEEVIPACNQTGNFRGQAIALGQIADILQARGDFDGALRIHQEEVLPLCEKLGDTLNRAITLGKIADIFQARGDLDAALRIRQEEELPIYEKLDNLRLRAITLGKVAEILQARGDLDPALLILTKELLPAFEKLGDDRSHSVMMVMMGQILAVKRQFRVAMALLVKAKATFDMLRLPEADQTEEIHRQILSKKVHSVIGDSGIEEINALFASGQTDEANRIIQNALAQPDPE